MSSSALGAAHSLRFDRFEVRPRERRVLVDREPAALGARAFDILLALIERRDRLVPKSELLDIVWPDTVVEENNLQVHISALRKLLGQSAIATIPGRGYRFTLAPHDDTAADTPHSTLPAPLSPLAGSGAWDKERGISGPAPTERLDRRVDDRLGRRLVGIADCQKNDIPALVAQPCSLHVGAPGAGAPSGDTIDQWREPHVFFLSTGSASGNSE